MSHCAASYAAVLSLILVGGQDALNMIDRKAMYGSPHCLQVWKADVEQRWKWLGQLKKTNGGFTLCVGGEEDIRYVFRTDLEAKCRSDDSQGSILRAGRDHPAQSSIGVTGNGQGQRERARHVRDRVAGISFSM